MRIGNKNELIFQISIILICLVILFIRSLHTPIQAQLTCGGEPALRDPANPKSVAWPQGKTFAVTVFDPTTDAEFQSIGGGLLDWNVHKVTNCSNVTFLSATRSTGPYDPDSQVPNDTIWVYRTTNTQFDPEFRYIGGTQLWEIRAAKIRLVNPWTPSMTFLRKIISHESGHGFGLRDETFPGVEGRSIMGLSWEVTQCDNEAIRRVYCPAPTPTPTPEPCYYEQEERPSDPSGYGELMCEVCQDGYDNDCVSGTDYEDYKCLDCTSPVVIDTLGDGFDLTSAQNGVAFDIAGVGRPAQVSWTQGDDAWLTLDRNGNGTIDSGRELFGAVTSQPAGVGRNGFLALAEYDKPANAGNGDGVIDNRDAIFSSLRLWQDSNHNGFSEQSELHTLPSMNVERLDLDYHESRRVDAYGNRFRYRAKVRDAQGADVGRWAWDVFLAHESPNNRTGLAPEASILLAPKLAVFRFAKPRCRG